jgi:hypothetical protein
MAATTRRERSAEIISPYAEKVLSERLSRFAAVDCKW